MARAPSRARQRESWASLLELTQRGKEPIALPDGETRGYLAGRRRGDLPRPLREGGCARIGFGECRAVITPARREHSSGKIIRAVIARLDRAIPSRDHNVFLFEVLRIEDGGR